MPIYIVTEEEIITTEYKYKAESKTEALEMHQAGEDAISTIVVDCRIEDTEVEFDWAEKYPNG